MKNTNTIRALHFFTCIIFLISLAIFNQPDFNFIQDKASLKNFLENLYVSMALGGIIAFAGCCIAIFYKKSNKPIFISGVLAQFFLLIAMSMGPGSLFTIIALLFPLLFVPLSLTSKVNYQIKESRFWFNFYLFLNMISAVFVFIRMV